MVSPRAGQTVSVSEFRVDGFAPGPLQADWIVDSGPGPKSALSSGDGVRFRFADFSPPGPKGDQVELVTGSNLPTGSWSAYFFVDSDAHSYAKTAWMTIFTNERTVRDPLVANSLGNSASIATFAPAVPEPGSWLMLAFGVVALRCFTRQRAGCA